MIVNSNPSTPEHMKSNLLSAGGDQTTSSGVDLNCNHLNHSQPQQLPLTHNHNYSYNQYFNNINNNNELNNRIQTNINTNQTNGLMNYEMDNDLNPMDFIDNDIPTPDETLFNLDTFDILGDIDDHLDELSQTSNYRNSNLNQTQTKTIKSDSSATISSAQDYREITANITDYSPEWCYPEGIHAVTVVVENNDYKYDVNYRWN